MKNHEPAREKQQTEQAWQQAEAQYRATVRPGLEKVCAAERLHDRQARKRTGITQPVRTIEPYGRKPTTYSPEFYAAMQRLWDVGTIDTMGHADTELRRPYHLIAHGRVPVTEADVIKLGRIPEARLRLLLPWLAHRLSLEEAQDHTDLGEVAPPVLVEEDAADNTP